MFNAARPIFLDGLSCRPDVQAGFVLPFDLDRCPTRLTLRCAAATFYRASHNGTVIARGRHGRRTGDMNGVIRLHLPGGAGDAAAVRAERVNWQAAAPPSSATRWATPPGATTTASAAPRYVNDTGRNDTGRNDIAAAEVTFDAGRVSFYVRIAARLSAASDDWMTLYVDADYDPATGWLGYDLRVSPGRKTVEANVGGRYTWAAAGTADVAIGGDAIELSVPRSRRPGSVCDFKWADHCQRLGDWTTSPSTATPPRTTGSLPSGAQMTRRARRRRVGASIVWLSPVYARGGLGGGTA